MLASLGTYINPDWAPLALRAALGFALSFRGYPMLFSAHSQFAARLESNGFRPGAAWAWLVGITNFAGGILLALGFLTEFVAVAICIEFLVILIAFKWGKEPYIQGPDGRGWELALVYFIVALSLLFLGPGQWSLDWMLLYRH